MEIRSPGTDPGESKNREGNPGTCSATLPFRKNRGLQFICLAYGVFWLFLAIEPRNRFDWALENLLVLLSVGLLFVTHRKYVFSNSSYGLFALFLALHALGAHDTYSQTPLGFQIAEIFGSERNHFDRIVHFCFGLLLAYPALEVSRNVFGVGGLFLRVLLAFSLLAAASSLYELIEWVAAMILEPEAALAFLGTQGDVFDAQKDTALAALGSVIGLGLSVVALRTASSKRR